MIRLALFVILAGIAGTLANAFAASVVVAPGKLAMMYDPGRYGVAIAVAALIPVIYKLVSGKVGFIFAVIILTIVPSLLAKLYFGAGAPWDLVLRLNLVYAAVATALYSILSRVFASR